MTLAQRLMWMLRQIGAIFWAWLDDAGRYLISPVGYRVIVPTVALLLGAYVLLYTILETRHEHLMNQATFQQTQFITMAVSGNPGALRAALLMYKHVRDLSVPKAPNLLNPLSWASKSQPNVETLSRWTKHFFSGCDKHNCGVGLDLRDVGLDLRGAHFAGATLYQVNLAGADLTGANLNGANLAGADLTGANLEGAELKGSYLGKADLTGARLEKTNLEGAVLGAAKLGETNLADANLARADLAGADLAGANVTGTNLAGANLQNITGLIQQQINVACPDNRTVLPDDIQPPQMQPETCKKWQ
jgi:uncharacterized protein YjbI with pentapeptide repeats